MNTQATTAVTEIEDIEAIMAALTQTAAEEAQAEEKSAADELLDLDETALLEELNFGSSVSDTTVLDDDLLADFESVVARAESYEKQDGGPEMAEAATVSVPAAQAQNNAAAAQPKQKAARKPKDPNAAPKQPKAPRLDLNALPDVVFEDVIGQAADKAGMLAKRPAQVKIAEKFDNLFLALHAGKEPSTYTVQAFKLLNTQKTITQTDIVNTYKAIGLKDGTARSQAGQLIAMMHSVGIGLRSGQSITINADSAIAAKLRTILGVA